MKRGVSNHAFRRFKERSPDPDRFQTITAMRRWLNSDVPPGEGLIEFEGYTLVFSPIRPSGKQDLITVWPTNS